MRDAFLTSYTDALSVVFLVAAGVAALGFLLTWLLPERPLRETVVASNAGDRFGVPREPDSLREIERALSVLASRDTRRAIYERLARQAGVDLPALAIWLLAQLDEQPGADPAELADRHALPRDSVAEAASALEARGYVRDGVPTDAGREALDRIRTARRERLAEHLDGWSPDQHAELADLLRRLAREPPPEPVAAPR